MVRVDDQIPGVRHSARGGTPHEKMSGEVDPDDVQAGATGDLHVNQRERDRDARPAIQHLVEKTVPRVVVLNVVAGEVQLAEQVGVERHHVRVADGIDMRRRFRRDHRRARDTIAGFIAERVKLIEVRAGIELRVLDARNHQRRHRQVRVGAERRVRKAFDEALLDHAFIVPKTGRCCVLGCCVLRAGCWTFVRVCVRGALSTRHAAPSTREVTSSRERRSAQHAEQPPPECCSRSTHSAFPESPAPCSSCRR